MLSSDCSRIVSRRGGSAVMYLRGLILGLVLAISWESKALNRCARILEVFGWRPPKIDIETLNLRHDHYSKLKGTPGSLFLGQFWMDRSQSLEGPLLLLPPETIQRLPKGSVLWSLNGDMGIHGVDPVSLPQSRSSLRWGLRPVHREFEFLRDRPATRVRLEIPLESQVGEFLAKVLIGFSADKQVYLTETGGLAEAARRSLLGPLRNLWNEYHHPASTQSSFLRRAFPSLDWKAIDLWKKLGLEEAYLRRFRNDFEFWNSEKSLVEVYLELRALNLD